MKMFTAGAKKKKQFYRFPCPWCQQMLQANDVVFRYPTLRTGKETMLPDAYLRNYRQSIGDPFAVDTKAVFAEIVDPAFPQEEDTLHFKEDGYLTGMRVVRNGIACELEVRLCPYCHNPLYKEAGCHQEKSLSVVGTPNAGKSTFLAAMLYQLQRDGLTLHNASNDIRGNQERTIDGYLNLLVSGQLLPSTHGKMKPVTYLAEADNLNVEPFFLTIQDIPGEDFSSGDDTKIKRTSNFISRAGLCIFLLDLENLAMAKEVAENLWRNYSDYLKTDTVYMAMVLYKGDLITQIFPILRLHSEIDLKLRSPATREINRAMVKNFSDTIQRLICKQSPELKQVEAVFRRFQFGDRMQWFVANGMRKTSGKNQLEFAPEGCDWPILWWLNEQNVYSNQKQVKGAGST